MDEGGIAIAMQNSSLLQNREPLTAALSDRFINCVVHNYTLLNITKITKAICGSRETAKILADHYKRLFGRGEDVIHVQFSCVSNLCPRAAQ
jgi:hypothetical protein